ncbi:phosphonate ABC transporter, permease protein PhnE [Alkalibacterium olivapovliticus]|uniref:Phosphonate transport system permease protein n=1 Tax=Alkalibacterium olivapovliticus TaxID=99907 RepID=A0A2T0W5M7_9LACT|nr:phosphonate ABC transporter, permease protein PhnE [Alkalibacterium olivapovliticus]PRY81374.1 phosphonate transport system permease protein [Alkalibacterium olivapovliticus]
MNNQKKISLRSQRSVKQKTIITLIVTSLVLLYAFSLWSQDFTIASSQSSPLTILYRLFIVPIIDPTYWSSFVENSLLMLETVAIAYAGGIAASLFALPLAVFSAKNSGGKVSYVGKVILNAIRSIPELLFGVFFVAAVGPGSFAGVLAISINSIGMIGKLYAESIESIDRAPVDAIKASGGNRLQAFWYGILPQILPQFLSISLFRFEIDVRASTILGLVGAGGIGVPLILSQQQRHWEEVGVILIIVIVFVVVIDQLSGKIRTKLV